MGDQVRYYDWLWIAAFIIGFAGFFYGVYVYYQGLT